MAEEETWDQPERILPEDRMAAEALIVDVDGFEGPLDLLLMLSRSQKVDLRKVSVLQLAEQYLLQNCQSLQSLENSSLSQDHLKDEIQFDFKLAS